MSFWMRWANVVGLFLAAGLAVYLCFCIESQEVRIKALRADLERVDEYLPRLIRSELAAQEARIIQRIEFLLVGK